MTRTYWILALGLLLPAAAGAQDPPGTAGIMGQYRLWFAAVDANKDGFLDKEELARAFRGPQARPFDYVPPKSEKDKKEEKDKKPDEETPSEKDKKPAEEKPGVKRDYSRFIDYQFLTQLDRDNDERISRQEFDSWARDLALQLKNQIDTQQRLLETQARLSQPKLKPQDRRKFEDQLRREREALKRAKDRAEKLERHFREAQKKKAIQDRKKKNRK
jgi:hypothetical protein